MEEIKLVEAFRGGEKAAFDKLYEEYKTVLLRMAYLVSGSLSDAEDIVQETFIKCYQHIGELKNPQGFRAWLFQILYRSAYRQLKKSAREVPKEEVEIYQNESLHNSSLDKIIENETQEQIKDAVQNLDFHHRAVVVMYYYNEMTTKEMAKTLACTEGTIKSRLYRARKKLRKSLIEWQEGGTEYEKQEKHHFS